MADSTYILCIGLGWFPNSPGGSERYVYELTHHLAVEHRVELCGVGFPEAEPASPVKLTNLCEPDWPLWQRLWSTRSRFMSRKAAIPAGINLHFPLYSLPLISSLPSNVPVTFTFHGPWALESEQEGENKLSVFAKSWLERRIYERCDRFIVLSKAFGNILHEHYGVPWDKIHIIPGGVDIHRFQPNLSRQQAREQLNWSQERMIIFTPRRLVHRMGLDKLLNALAKIKSTMPEVWLAIAGKGPLRDELEQQVTALELKEQVKFLGFLPDEQLPIAYQAADLTVMPSQSLEGFGLVLLESLACGTPALCTPVGGMPEVLAAFSPELITDSAEATAIAHTLESILTGEISLPSRLACRDYAATHFNWSDIARQVQQVILA